MIQAAAKPVQQTLTEKQWTEIISPEASSFHLNLRELWKYRDLLLLFVRRDIIAQYRQTVLGPVWHLIQPVLTALMFLLVFNKIASIQTGPLPPMLFYLSSITIWSYFQNCFGSTAATFINNAGIFGKVYFPRLILPMAIIAANVFKLAIQSLLVVALIIFYSFTNAYHFTLGWNVLLLPAVVFVMAGMSLGLGIIISSITTKYRDLTVLISFGIQLLMYVTPVAYPLSYLKDSKYRAFIEWNPLSPVIEGFRYAIFGSGSFSAAAFIYSSIFMIAVLLAGIYIFNKVERNFMDTV